MSDLIRLSRKVLPSPKSKQSLPNNILSVIVPLSVVFCILLAPAWLSSGYSRESVIESSLLLAKIGNTVKENKELQQHSLLLDHDDGSNNKLHIVITTDCSYYMTWMSYVFFYHAMEVKQPGHITRIASGCTEVERQALTKHFEEDIKVMSNRFHLHFTPTASSVSKYFNKPIALQHWMENVLGFPRASHDDTIIAIFDPDMMLLKPFVNNFSGMPNESWNEGAHKRPIRGFVERGFPIAQEYAYEDEWTRITTEEMVNIVGKDSPVHNVSKDEAKWYFPAGPPFVLAASDLYQIAPLWLDFSMGVHRIKPIPMSEMYGYSLAAAHLGLKHQLSLHLMVSDPYNEDEAWPVVEKIPPREICNDVEPDRLPHAVHYCQQYAIGGYCFNKWPLYDNFLTCEGPLMYEPPKDAAVQFNYSRFKDSRETVLWTGSKNHLRFAFMTCKVISGLNRAATFFKRNRCGDKANYKQEWSFLDQ